MSTRRTAKITTSTPRGYVAIRVDFLSPETQSLRCTACKDKHYVGTEGTFVDIKAGEVFYLVRAASLGADMFYIVRLVTGQKRCSCAGNRPCKHELFVASKETQRKAKPPVRQAKKPAAPAAPVSPTPTPSEPAASLPVPVLAQPATPAQMPTPALPVPAPTPSDPAAPVQPAALQQRAAASISAAPRAEYVPGTLNGNRPFRIPR